MLEAVYLELQSFILLHNVDHLLLELPHLEHAAKRLHLFLVLGVEKLFLLYIVLHMLLNKHIVVVLYLLFFFS